MKAIISPCQSYRYVLQRGDSTSNCVVVMLNPSTADDVADDATIRKLNRFTRDWGYASYSVVNCYAFRSTDPAALASAADPVGPDNDFYLDLMARKRFIVAAWGNDARPQRVQQVVSALTRYGNSLYCFGTNMNGSPKHPLYVPYDTVLKLWTPSSQVHLTNPTIKDIITP